MKFKLSYLEDMKSLVESGTFWFGLAQIIFGAVGLITQKLEYQTAATLIMTGLGTIGFRLKTSAPIGSVLPQ